MEHVTSHALRDKLRWNTRNSLREVESSRMENWVFRVILYFAAGK